MVCNHVGDFYDGLRISAWAFNKFKKRTFLTRFDTAGMACFLMSYGLNLALTPPAKQMLLVLNILRAFGRDKPNWSHPGTAFVWSIRKQSMFCWFS